MVFQRPIHVDISKPLPPDLAEALALQNRLRHDVRLIDDFGPLKIIAGVDVGYDLARNLTKAVITLLSWPDLTLETSVIAYSETSFPYVSGFLSFRELPAILKALSCAPVKPDLLMVDGQGISHPRRLGIAAHLGVVTDIPSIGVAKSRLYGTHAELGEERFAATPLRYKDEPLGYVLRSKQGCKPLFVSAGHRISHESALDITKLCLNKYRLPDPTRLADQVSKWPLTTNMGSGDRKDLQTSLAI